MPEESGALAQRRAGMRGGPKGKAIAELRVPIGPLVEMTLAVSGPKQLQAQAVAVKLLADDFEVGLGEVAERTLPGSGDCPSFRGRGVFWGTFSWKCLPCQGIEL